MEAEGELMEVEAPRVPSTLLKYLPPMKRNEAVATFGPNIVFDATKSQDPKPMITAKDNVLNLVLPPRELGDDWVQVVSPEVPSRNEVRELTNLFEYRLKESKARMSGVCDVRSVIYAMCFNELIRQVTVDCAERGLLLMRIRDEIRMSTDAYKCLYEASVGLGRRKALEAERGKQDMRDKIKSLQETKNTLVAEVRRLQAKLGAMQRCCQEQQQADQKKYSEEIQFLNHTKQRLSQQEAAIKQMQEEEKKRTLGGA